MRVDKLFVNGNFYNSYFKRFFAGYAAVLDGRFLHVGVGEKDVEQFEADERVDLGGRYVIPGLIDIHMHIESSMSAPMPFCDYLVKYGVTTIVSEPHEIANAFGIEGIQAMIDACDPQKMDVYYGISSSVPSTSEELETTGGIIGMDELKALMDAPGILCLGEVMDTRGVLNDPDSRPNQFVRYLRQHKPDMPLEGHCPRIKGVELSRYIYTGIDSDHTEHDLEEVQHRYFKGMFFELQNKMLKKEVIDFICENQLFEHTAFVTDDTMADVLVHKGHLNTVAAGAVELGMRVEDAVYCATYTAARRMRLFDRGAIAPGRIADMVVMEDLPGFVAHSTYKNGRLVYDSQIGIEPVGRPGAFPKKFYHSVQVKPVAADTFVLKASGDSVTVRAMQVHPDRTQTSEQHFTLPVADGQVQWESGPAALTAVFERYGKNGGIGWGFTSGGTIKRGAVATTYAHDHHNLMVVGRSATDMALAVNQLIEMQGGMCVVENGKVLATIHLPVAGLLSEEPMEETGRQLAEVQDAMRALGYEHYEPVMSFCTTSLPVSPELKITDKGLVEVKTGKLLSWRVD
ncbi:adenine deaminase C-terminal domain-containing protein [Neobittarella massiliensis]|uniref:adenine deaminase C-terminal domain-containing protein n=1 Tax=Neobittarella massiliensis (ex Bilen et al. 2018) TaxID=2041842 RepID=UPI000CF70C5D|nr:adenine deaminase C-terminal domain-containing protein [Neobittarella massiliensis]